jgi:hypothetical protein
MTNIEQVKDKIRKLMNVAKNDAASEGEIENAIRAAQALLMKHQLSEDEIGEAGRRHKMQQDKAFTRGRHVSTWECGLASFVRDFVGAVSVYKESNIPYKIFCEEGRSIQLKGAFTFYGPEEDVALAIELFSDLQLLIATMARRKYQGLFKGKGRMYAEGFTGGLNSQLQRSRAQLKRDKSSTALVVQSEKRNQVIRREATEWLNREQGVSLTTSSRRGNYNSATIYQDGFQDGKNTEVSKDRQKKLGAS